MKKRKNYRIVMLVIVFMPSMFGVRAVKAAALSTPGSITVKAYNKTGAKITWKAVAGANGYRVYRRTSGQSWKGIRTVTKDRHLQMQD